MIQSHDWPVSPKRHNHLKLRYMKDFVVEKKKRSPDYEMWLQAMSLSSLFHLKEKQQQQIWFSFWNHKNGNGPVRVGQRGTEPADISIVT